VGFRLGFGEANDIAGFAAGHERHRQHAQFAQTLSNGGGYRLRGLAQNRALFGGSKRNSRMKLPTVGKMRKRDERASNILSNRDLFAFFRWRTAHVAPSPNRECGQPENILKDSVPRVQDCECWSRDSALRTRP
jgi:hypothetical protein